MTHTGERPEVNLIALCSWYQEQPEWIGRYIQGLKACEVTHVVAIDGAYAAFPGATARSSSAEHQAFIAECHAHDIDLTLRVPRTPWAGNEVEKRNHLFAAAEAIAKPGDWYLILDVDEHITQAPIDLRAQLSDTYLHVGTLHLRTREDPDQRTTEDMTAVQRRFMRATPGLRLHGTHWRYVTPAGEHYWSEQEMVPALELDVQADHFTKHRPPARIEQRGAYYRHRDETGLEAA